MPIAQGIKNQVCIGVKNRGSNVRMKEKEENLAKHNMKSKIAHIQPIRYNRLP